MTGPPASRRPALGAAPALYWLVALVAYGVLGAFFPPWLLLGFWQAIPLLFLVTWLAGRLFGGNGPVAPADDPGPPGDPRR